MIAWLKGEVLDAQGDTYIIRSGAVAYEVVVGIQTSGRLGLCPGAECELAIATVVVRDKESTLVGFADFATRRVFRRLIEISGVGAKVALSITDAISTQDLLNCINTQNFIMLESIPGIGKKTAKRIVLELESKLEKLLLLSGEHTPAQGDLAQPTPALPGSFGGDRNAQITTTLKDLGFTSAQIATALNQIDPELSLEEALKAALQLLDSGK